MRRKHKFDIKLREMLLNADKYLRMMYVCLKNKYNLFTILSVYVRDVDNRAFTMPKTEIRINNG